MAYWLIALLGLLAFFTLALVSIRRAARALAFTLPATQASISLAVGSLILQPYYLLGGVLLWATAATGRRFIGLELRHYRAPMATVLACIVASGIVHGQPFTGFTEAAKWAFNFCLVALFARLVAAGGPAELVPFVARWAATIAVFMCIAVVFYISPFEYLPALQVDVAHNVTSLTTHVPKLRFDTGLSWPSLALGLGNDFNQTAGFAMIGALLGIAGALGRPRRVRSICVVILLVVALALTFTRSAWLGLLAGSIVFAVFVRRRRLAVLLGTLVIVTAVATSGPVRERVTLSFREESRNRDTRLELWSVLLETVGSNPWLGMGPRSAASLVTAEAVRIGAIGESEVRTAAHNPFLTLWAENGLPALLALAYIVTVAVLRAFFWIRGHARDEPSASFAAASLAAALCGGNVFVFFNPQFYCWYWLLLGACIGVPVVNARQRSGTVQPDRPYRR